MSLACIAVDPVAAQQVSPVTVTPQTLAPERRDSGFRVEIPEAGALHAPAGAEGLQVTLVGATLDGGFAEVAEQTGAVLERLRGHRVTLADIYAAASEIEAIHARAGYVLARVSVPPQRLTDGGDLRIAVTDGFIESVDVSALPARIRAPVRARAGRLAGKHHLRMADIETALMLTSDLPGLDLHSTLMRGSQPGGAKLVLEGNQYLLTGSIGFANQLDPSLGRWGVNAQVALNSALGLGEQIYGFAASDYAFTRWTMATARNRVLGGGIIVPLPDEHFSINPEATFARISPMPAAGTPQTVGTLRRLTLRISDTLLRRRSRVGALNLTVEQIDETDAAPAFAVMIAHDRYMAVRLGADFSSLAARSTAYGGAEYAGAVQLSQGLGDLASISAADALASGVPFSRGGAATGFTKLTASARVALPMGQRFTFSLMAHGQSSFGKPLFRAEQLALEGSDGLSAYVGGRTAVDEGMVARSEVSARVATGDAARLLPAVTPYLFAAFGAGRLEAPTALEKANISAFNLGGGLRATLARRISLLLEYARGLSSTQALDRVDRVNAATTFRF